MLQLDKKYIAELQKSGAQKLKVYLYEGGCSGKKIGVETEFDIDNSLKLLKSNFPSLYVPQTDAKHLQNGRLTRIIKADHTGKEKIRYIFTSNEIQERCSCGTSFAFEKKKPQIDFEKLKQMKAYFGK